MWFELFLVLVVVLMSLFLNTSETRKRHLTAPDLVAGSSTSIIPDWWKPGLYLPVEPNYGFFGDALRLPPFNPDSFTQELTIISGKDEQVVALLPQSDGKWIYSFPRVSAIDQSIVVDESGVSQVSIAIGLSGKRITKFKLSE